MVRQIIVIGVGNPFRQDDGVGSEVIRQLQQQDLDCVLLDGGTDGLALLDEIAKYQRAVLIDAVNMGMTPGTIKVFTPNEAKININADALSTHGFGVAELIQFMDRLNIKTALKIIGVQPKQLEFAEGLSDEVAKSIPEVIELIKQELNNV